MRGPLGGDVAESPEVPQCGSRAGIPRQQGWSKRKQERAGDR